MDDMLNVISAALDGQYQGTSKTTNQKEGSLLCRPMHTQEFHILNIITDHTTAIQSVKKCLVFMEIKYFCYVRK
jgi:hypothetical protein